MSGFPSLRLRRARHQSWSRQLVQESRLHPSDLILPLFVHDEKSTEPVPSMPGVARMTVKDVADAGKKAKSLGIQAVALFPVISDKHKDEGGTHAWDPTNLVCKATKAIKNKAPDLGIICDVALDPFTSHGQDGIVSDGAVLNDETVDALCKQAVIQAEAGADVLAPSDMMDGRIGAIRAALDNSGHKNKIVLSYAAKYASSFYGPFRDAVGSSAALGSADKRTYQMDPGNSDEALREVRLDLEEGADWVMVKPALPYLDVIYRVKTNFKVPTLAYHVSGEYAMLHAAGQNGWLDLRKTMWESVVSIKRAGADAILTYAAMDLAEALG